MRPIVLRAISFALVSTVLLPVLTGCGRSQKAMQTPDGLSNRQRRDQSQGTSQ